MRTARLAALPPASARLLECLDREAPARSPGGQAYIICSGLHPGGQAYRHAAGANRRELSGAIARRGGIAAAAEAVVPDLWLQSVRATDRSAAM